MARFSSDSITGSKDCASSRVKVFMGECLLIQDTPEWRNPGKEKWRDRNQE
jgi:hypothetical protein